MLALISAMVNSALGYLFFTHCFYCSLFSFRMLFSLLLDLFIVTASSLSPFHSVFTSHLFSSLLPILLSTPHYLLFFSPLLSSPIFLSPRFSSPHFSPPSLFPLIFSSPRPSSRLRYLLLCFGIPPLYWLLPSLLPYTFSLFE